MTLLLRSFVLSLCCSIGTGVLPAIAGQTTPHVGGEPVRELDRFERQAPAEFTGRGLMSRPLEPAFEARAALATPSTPRFAALPVFIPAYHFGRPVWGEGFDSLGCSSAFAAVSFAPTVGDPFAQTCFTGSVDEVGSSSPLTLTPGRNKDALYGRGYTPDANVLQ